MGKTALAVIAPAETAIGSPSTTARRLVRDAFQRTFEVAVLITNDSDLSEPVRIVRQELNLPVGMVLSVQRELISGLAQ